MNYFAHGIRFLEQPYYLAGTALPDWLNVVDRRVRVRSQGARPWVTHPDSAWRDLAQGVLQHHHDDRWFHQSRTFADLSHRFTEQLRELLQPDPGFRPLFVGHILVELLLDSVLIERNSEQLDKYYDQLDTLDGEVISQFVNRCSRHPTDRMSWWLRRFCEERFLYDYPDNEKLLTRLNQVMRRVQLNTLPDSMLDLLVDARRQVRDQTPQLLPEGTFRPFLK